MHTTILAIETSTELCSVALASAHDVRVAEEHTGAQSSTRVLPMVQSLLAQTNITLRDLSAIAFGAGPGSFTGIRTACALAQGLAFGADLPIISVDTLLACAERAYRETGLSKILVTLDARMGEVYWGEYFFDTDAWQVLTPPSVSPPIAVQAQQLDYCVVGNASTLFPEAQFNQLAKNRYATITPRADYIATLACHAFAKGQAQPAARAYPIYVRNKVALTTQERQQPLNQP
jgi:tRNA threonylcarbamoyladenosine biosynthesis protein TsaB